MAGERYTLLPDGVPVGETFEGNGERLEVDTGALSESTVFEVAMERPLDPGLPVERRPYQAHMTLARKFSASLPPAEAPAIDWDVGSFCLVQSVNSDNGVSYRVLRSWTLEGG